jgi:hypothetical protein
VMLSLCPPQIPYESPWERELLLITVMIRILISCCPRECRVWGVNLAAHQHLVSRLRINGALIRLSHIFMTYRGSIFHELGCFLISKRTNRVACTTGCFITYKCASQLHEHCGTYTNNAWDEVICWPQLNNTLRMLAPTSRDEWSMGLSVSQQVLHNKVQVCVL